MSSQKRDMVNSYACLGMVMSSRHSVITPEPYDVINIYSISSADLQYGPILINYDHEN